MEGFELAVQKACHVFGVEKLFSEQFESLKTFVSGTLVFLNLPTWFRKSFVFQMAPLVYAKLSRGHDGFAANPVILVISPLVNLMEKQTNLLQKLDGLIGEDKALDLGPVVQNPD